MKTEDIRYFGDLAKMRQLLESVDKDLSLTGDSSLFSNIHADKICIISEHLLQARMAISNILASDFGDIRGMETQPPKQEFRDKYKPLK